MSQTISEVAFRLTDPERRFLLSLARRSLEAAVRREPSPAPPEVPSVLEARLSAFVSLHKQVELRGCVGYVQTGLPLYRTVMDAAAAAALRDPRFPPLRPPELHEVELEISVLSSFRSVRPDEIEVGSHGLMITQDRARGLLLPQVAVARQWDRERFLEETCRKAGLPPDAWRRGAIIEGFTAEVFRERNPADGG
jgi:AmmeMemoRadiSam system protein A